MPSNCISHLFRSILSFITALGIVATTVIAWLVYRARHNLPLASVSPWRQPAPDLPRVVRFKLDRGAKSKWLVRKVYIRDMRGPCLSGPGEEVRGGEVLGYHPRTPWQRSFVFDPPVSDGVVLLHPDVPTHFSLSLSVSLRTQPRVRRRVRVLCVPKS